MSVVQTSAPDHFAFAIAALLRQEGGWNPNDPGGGSNFGISKRRFPDVDVVRLTKADAVRIYRAVYWDKYGLGRLTDVDVATKLLDMMVNCGEETAIALLQRALNYLLPVDQALVVDGVIGPKTVAAANAMRQRMLVLALRAYHARRYQEIVEAPDVAPYQKASASGWLARALA